MAVTESSSFQMELQHSSSSTSSSPRPPRTLSPIKKPLPNSLSRPFLEPPLQALPSIEPLVTKTEGQSTAIAHTANDSLPLDLVQSLKRQSNNTLTPRASLRQRHPPLPKSSVTAPVSTKAPPANAWNYPNRRSKLKHLTEAPPCICGAGKDISFLYDAELAMTASKETEPVSKELVVLPSTIIPEEYHIVKHPGVLGLEYHDDPYVTRSEDHDHHMTLFPSMRPAGRHEAVTLKHTLESMLKKAGVPKELNDSHLKGPTVMHNLLELLQKEQAIYNVCFHELIRQVSVHCVERGDLLADIRRRYNNLLDRIPRQIKSLHDELVAQRALDRKLGSELRRFKGKISNLTDQLCEVKDHDLHVTEQSRLAEGNLAAALADSEKNANLLSEYHALYELQRKRLEEQVGILTFERDIWQQGSYDLAARVAQECSLQTLQRVQLCEKSWCKLAGHFAVILSDKDTHQLSEIQGYVQEWRENVVGVTKAMISMENTMRERLAKVEKSMHSWSERFYGILNSDTPLPKASQVEQLFSDIKIWQDVINQEADNFTGDNLLSNQEQLTNLRSLMEAWTEVAVKIFTRHQEEAEIPENTRMQALNLAVDRGLKIYEDRISGENGVATGFIHIMTPLETWDTKLSLYLSSHDKSLPASEWAKFSTLLKEWTAKVGHIMSCIGSDNQTKLDRATDSEAEVDDKDEYEVLNAPLTVLMSEAEKWRAALSHAIDSSDNLITEQVSRLHSSLVKWMVELLLNLTSSLVTPDEFVGHRQHITTTADIKSQYTTLTESASDFTKRLIRKCLDVVREIVDERVKEDFPNPEEEQIELRRMETEIEEWIKLAGILLEQTDAPEPPDKSTEDEVKDGETKSPAGDDGGDPAEELPKTMSALGIDGNIHSKSLQQAIDETERPPIASSAELGLATEDMMPEVRAPLQKDIEALIISLDESKAKLKEQEEITSQVEERAVRAEKELEEAQGKVSELESELQQVKATLEQQTKNKGARSTSRNNANKRNSRTITTPVRPPSRK